MYRKCSYCIHEIHGCPATKELEKKCKNFKAKGKKFFAQLPLSVLKQYGKQVREPEPPGEQK